MCSDPCHAIKIRTELSFQIETPVACQSAVVLQIRVLAAHLFWSVSKVCQHSLPSTSPAFGGTSTYWSSLLVCYRTTWCSPGRSQQQALHLSHLMWYQASATMCPPHTVTVLMQELSNSVETEKLVHQTGEVVDRVGQLLHLYPVVVQPSWTWHVDCKELRQINSSSNRCQAINNMTAVHST